MIPESFRFLLLDQLKFNQVKYALNGLCQARIKTECLLVLPSLTEFSYERIDIILRELTRVSKCLFPSKGSTSTITREFPPGSTSGTISGLFPGKTYLFRIQAKTKIGSGNSTKWEQVMPIWGEKTFIIGFS